MELRNWVWTQADQALADKWMRDLPEKMLDVHAHIYRMCDLGKQFSPYIHGPDVAGHDIWKECVQRFVVLVCHILESMLINSFQHIL